MRDEIIELLTKKNNDLNNTLISKNIKSYVNKLLNNASIVCSYERGNLNGFIAFYANDYSKFVAYLSMICTENNNFRLGKVLLEGMLAICINKKMQVIRLEVHEGNERAMKFYKKYNFIKKGMNGSMIIMEKILA